MNCKFKILISLLLFANVQIIAINQSVNRFEILKKIKVNSKLLYAATLFGENKTRDNKKDLDNFSQRKVTCMGNKCVVVEEICIGEVIVGIDKRIYNAKIKIKDDYIYGDTIYFTIQNNSQKNMFFNTGMIIPFTSLYIENFKNGRWQFYRNLHGTAELPFNYTSNDWIKMAVCLKSGQKYTSKYKIVYSADQSPYIDGKYRFKLEYCTKLTEKDDWLLRQNVIGEETRKNIFKTVYSDEFKIK